MSSSAELSGVYTAARSRVLLCKAPFADNMSDTEETARSVKEGRTSTTEGSKPAEDLLAWREEVQRMNPARISKELDKITSDFKNNDMNENFIDNIFELLSNPERLEDMGKNSLIASGYAQQRADEASVYLLKLLKKQDKEKAIV